MYTYPIHAVLQKHMKHYLQFLFIDKTSDSGVRKSWVKQFLLSFFLHLPCISLPILLFSNYLIYFDLDVSLNQHGDRFCFMSQFENLFQYELNPFTFIDMSDVFCLASVIVFCVFCF